jgi:RNA polymerase sigma-70 factor (ECF subfamily)
MYGAALAPMLSPGTLPAGRPSRAATGARVEAEADERAETWRSWMIAAQAGDRDAYRRLLADLLPFVRRIVLARTGDGAAADDVTQEVLLSIHSARHTYRPERPLLPWVRAIARNASVDWARGRARRREVGLEAGVDAPADSSPDRAILSRGLERALQSLPDAQREAVVLLKLEGLSVKEAAARIGISEGALKLRAHRGYRALRDLVGREIP